jgi:hypothetical protein
VKDKRTGKNGLEFLIGWHDYPNPIDDTREPISLFGGSDNIIDEFNKEWEA